MPYASVSLVPGANVERTPMLLRAGVSQTSLIRYRDSLIQKYGGWATYYPYGVPGVPRDMHGWQDLNNTKHLAVGTTTSLSVITSGTLKDITPQTLISDFFPNISTTANSPIVAITDPNIAYVTVEDAVFSMSRFRSAALFSTVFTRSQRLPVRVRMRSPPPRMQQQQRVIRRQRTIRQHLGIILCILPRRRRGLLLAWWCLI